MISEVDIADMRPVIKVKEIKENEDGSADCEIYFNAAGLKFLVNFAFVEVLKQAIEQGKVLTPEANDNPTN